MSFVEKTDERENINHVLRISVIAICHDTRCFPKSTAMSTGLNGLSFLAKGTVLNPWVAFHGGTFEQVSL